MAIRNIVKEGDPVLRKICRPVTEITPHISTLLDDMVDTLRNSGGVGLAAPQVGVVRRIVVVEVEEGQLYEMINPRIIKCEGTQEEAEGCLSIPGKWGITHRPMTVTVEATARDGSRYTVSGSDLTARAFCHEIDHLDGILFTDKAVKMLDPDEIEDDE